MVRPDSEDLVRMQTFGTSTVRALESTGTAFDNLTTFTFAPIASMTIKTATEEVFTFLPLENSTKAMPSPTAMPSTEQSTPDGEVMQNASLLTTESSACVTIAGVTSSVTTAGGPTTEKASNVDQVEKPDKAESTEVSSNELTTERSKFTGSTLKVEDSSTEEGETGNSGTDGRGSGNSEMESTENSKKEEESDKKQQPTASGSDEHVENNSNSHSIIFTTPTTASDGFLHSTIAIQSSDESSDEDNRNVQPKQPQQPPSSTTEAIDSDEKTGNDLDLESQSPPVLDPLEVTSELSPLELTSSFPSTEDDDFTEPSKTSPLLDFAYFNDRNESKVANDSRKPRLRNFFYYYFLTAIRVNESRERELNRTFEEAGHDRLWGLPGDPISVAHHFFSFVDRWPGTCDAIFHNFISTFSAPTQKNYFLSH